MKNEQPSARRRRAILADVHEAIPRALQSGSFFFNDIERNQVDEDGRALLRLLASGDGRSIAKKRQLQRKFGGDLVHAVDLLRRRGLIEEARGGYRLQVELIGKWFAQ